MAFNFVVETGVGDPDATSYVDLDFANDYIESNAYQSTAWAALTDDQKERLLVRASKIIDARITWVGERVEEDSGLRWPRSGVYDRDGFLIADDMIPVMLLEAVSEFAVALMQHDWTVPYSNNAFKKIEVGPIQLQFDDKYQQGAFPDIISQMLIGLGYLDSGKRPGFKKIVRT